MTFMRDASAPGSSPPVLTYTTKTSNGSVTVLLIDLAPEIQVHILTYLRAFDLSPLQQTCRFYRDPALMHRVVDTSAHAVYGAGLPLDKKMYSLVDLRNLELTLVAKILNSPEPKSGFYISKSWIKTTLKWLESINEEQAQQSSKRQSKKMTKKQQRQRARRLSDVSPPWPNANSDLLCSHANLSFPHSYRSKRRLLDKQAWKILKKLYPDSTTLDSLHGECLQCRLELETAKKQQAQDDLQAKLERKKPLANACVRQVYTRTRGVPTQALRAQDASTTTTTSCSCPLLPGTYHLLPRAWCHKWRRYLKTGEGEEVGPPDASALLCDAHRLARIPPHLQAYLAGQTSQLYMSVKSTAAAASVTTSPHRMLQDTQELARQLGLSPAELAAQRMALLRMDQQQQQPAPQTATSTMKEQLDRENYSVVEIVTADEWKALQASYLHPNFSISFTVHGDSKLPISFSTRVCQDCDASGSSCQLAVQSSAAAKKQHRPRRSTNSNSNETHNKSVRSPDKRPRGPMLDY